MKVFETSTAEFSECLYIDNNKIKLQNKINPFFIFWKDVIENNFFLKAGLIVQKMIYYTV